MLARWEPFGGIRRRRDVFGDLFDMQEQMNRMFSEFFGERESGLNEGSWLPAVDVSETKRRLWYAPNYRACRRTTSNSASRTMF